ncbi:hypothetical protein NGRA_0870 [Nosema granulosis]|uniref:UBX domain-containing protein n=1 Tax=Nosema granulosis TaxID=83296 RepID=A0A9P6L040_9MICR|nr:hypothetical protein NGRA_0870 [Nosema granulosis]
MENTTNETLTKEEIIEFLINSGYDDLSIREALRQTKSTDIDVLVDFMTKMEEQSAKVSRVIKPVDTSDDTARQETLKLIEENKKRILAERKYKDELIRRTIEDRKNKEKEEREREEREKLASSEEIKPVADCVINVRFPDSRSIMFYFSKEDTVNTVFEKIEEHLGSTSFTVYKPRNPLPIVRSDEKLEDNKLLYPKSVLFIEE